MLEYVTLTYEHIHEYLANLSSRDAGAGGQCSAAQRSSVTPELALLGFEVPRCNAAFRCHHQCMMRVHSHVSASTCSHKHCRDTRRRRMVDAGGILQQGHRSKPLTQQTRRDAQPRDSAQICTEHVDLAPDAAQ